MDIIHKIIRSRRRTLALQISPDATLTIRAPKWISLEDIHQVVRQKMPWILKRQRLARDTYRPQTEKNFVEGERFLYLGELYKLSMAPDSLEPLCFSGSEFLLRERNPGEAREHFISWYRRQASEVIGQRAKQYATNAGLQFKRITITGAKRRWGSCGPKGTLNFSWRLIMMPLKVLDYVVAHELAHLCERNHSERFWKKVETLYPDYREARKQLRANERQLKSL